MQQFQPNRDGTRSALLALVDGSVWPGIRLGTRGENARAGARRQPHDAHGSGPIQCAAHDDAECRLGSSERHHSAQAHDLEVRSLQSLGKQIYRRDA